MTIEEVVPPAERLVEIVNDLRKPFLRGLTLVGLVALGFFFLAPSILLQLQDHLHQELAFYTVAEPFLAHVKIGLAASLFTLAPLMITWFWRIMARPFAFPAAWVFWFSLGTTLLFYIGAGFCFFVTLPFGVDFLLGFQSEELIAQIGVGKFVGFVTVFVLAFGVVFELPVFMLFAAKTGLISRKAFAANRRYAILAISILAALLTPTPDVVNMLLMGGPLYLLYESGILLLTALKLP